MTGGVSCGWAARRSREGVNRERLFTGLPGVRSRLRCTRLLQRWGRRSIGVPGSSGAKSSTRCENDSLPRNRLGPSGVITMSPGFSVESPRKPLSGPDRSIPDGVVEPRGGSGRDSSSSVGIRIGPDSRFHCWAKATAAHNDAASAPSASAESDRLQDTPTAASVIPRQPGDAARGPLCDRAGARAASSVQRTQNSYPCGQCAFA